MTLAEMEIFLETPSGKVERETAYIVDDMCRLVDLAKRYPAEMAKQIGDIREARLKLTEVEMILLEKDKLHG